MSLKAVLDSMLEQGGVSRETEARLMLAGFFRVEGGSDGRVCAFKSPMSFEERTDGAYTVTLTLLLNADVGRSYLMIGIEADGKEMICRSRANIDDKALEWLRAVRNEIVFEQAQPKEPLKRLFVNKVIANPLVFNGLISAYESLVMWLRASHPANQGEVQSQIQH